MGSGMVGRYPAHSELKVEHGVIVLGMQHEGLDSEYTVMSSSSYSNSSEVKARNSEVWRFPGIGFSLCAVPTFSCVQGNSNGGYELSFWNVPEQRSVPERFQVRVQRGVKRRFRVRIVQKGVECASRISLSEESSRTRQIWVKFEFNIQNAETYMTRGT